MSETVVDKLNALAEFKVGVETVIFSVDTDQNCLLVMLVKRMEPPFEGQWALPGTFVRQGESLEQSAYRVLDEKIKVGDLYLEQLYSFGDRLNLPIAEAEPFSSWRYLSVSYFALVRFQDAELIGAKQGRTGWFSVDFQGGLERSLAFNHRDIIQYGYGRLQNKVTYSPIAFDLLPKRFTLNELFQFYCTILGSDFTDYSNFRSRLLKLGFFQDTGEKVCRGAGRPAALYQFDADAFLPFKDKPLVFV